jgi:hypothetical protein
MWFKKKPKVEPKVVPLEPVEEKEEPLEPVCSIRYSRELTSGLNRGHAFPPVFANVPEYNYLNRVWVYNVSTMDFEVDNPVLKVAKIPGRTLEEKYSVYTSFPMAMKMPKENVDNGEVQFVFMDGRRFAMDLINPDNLGLDQDAKLIYITSPGRDLGAKGVFWSLQNPPPKEAIDAARKRMVKRYKMLLEQVGTKIFVTGMSFNQKVKALVSEFKKTKYYAQYKPKQLKQMAEDRIKFQLGITPEHHAAAEHYKLKTEWHPALEPRLRRTQKCQ